MQMEHDSAVGKFPLQRRHAFGGRARVFQDQRLQVGQARQAIQPGIGDAGVPEIQFREIAESRMPASLSREAAFEVDPEIQASG